MIFINIQPIHYARDDQGSYSVGFNIYLEDQILGSLKWYTNDKSLDDFLSTKNDFEPLHNELVEYYDMVVQIIPITI